MREESVFSRLPLARRIAALFGSEEWRYLPSHSDLSLVSGSIAGLPLLLLATDPLRAKGTLGVAECREAAEALATARRTACPLLLLLDSAGARLDAGLAIQGALRQLLRQMLDARLDGLPMLALLGHHVFGGASLLAFVAGQRLYSAQTLLAMSGPRVLAGGGEPGHAAAVSAIAAPARTGYGGAERLLADDAGAAAQAVLAWLQGAVQMIAPEAELLAERAMLRARLAARLASGAKTAEVSAPAPGLALNSGQALGAAGALDLAERAESQARSRPGEPLLLEVDCPGHSLALADEALLLSHYLAHLALSLRQLVRAGTPVRLRVTGEISGGAYAALAGAVSCIELAAGAVVLTLPRSSLAHILKEAPAELGAPEQYLRQGVVDQLL